jgi:ABC-type antimicrobial peptide transport system permease subunit
MMAAAGAVLGLAGAMAVARAIRSMLFGVPTIDFVTMGIVAGALAIVVLLAVAVPARRALAVSPTEALKG